MALNLLLETYAEVTSLKTIESADIFESRRITVVLLPHSVVLINAETGLTLHTFDFPKKKETKVVDCVYVRESRCFLVAFAGSSLAAIAENAVSTANIDYISWPQQPLKLFSVKSKGIVVVCADSTVWHIALSNGVVPAATFTDPAPLDYKNTTCVSACSVGESISIIRKKRWAVSKEKKGVKNDKTNDSNDGEVTNCSVLTWNIPNTEPGSNRILSERSSIISEFQMGRREKVTNICGHDNSRSLSILLAPSSSSLSLKSNSSSSDSNTEFRWLKFDNYDGTLLFERKGSKKESDTTAKIPINIIASGNFLWMIFNDKACLWDARYGVELISLPVNIPEVLSNNLNCLASEEDGDCLNRSSGLSMIFAPEGVSSSQLSSYYLTMCIPHKVGASVFHTVLKIPTTQISGSLCNALGRLMPSSEIRPHDDATVVTTVKAKNGRKSKASKTEVAKKESMESILHALDENANKVLTGARMRMMRERESETKPTGGRKRPIDYEIVKEIEVEVVAEEVKISEPTEVVPALPASVANKQRKGGKVFNPRHDGPFCVLQFKVPFHLDLPTDIAHMFLDRFNALYPTAPHPSDWDILEVLLISGTVSGNRNGQSGHLLDQVIDANRFDILALMARHIPDLSEKNAVRYLFLCATASEDALVHLYIDFKGCIRHQSESIPPVDDMVLAEGKVEKREKKVTHGDLVTIMMECILKRGSSYSTILLSDALKKLVTPSLSVILLRVVSLFLRGLCAPLGIRLGLGEIGNDANDLVNIFTSTGTYIGGVHNTYGDEHIQRAITWAEALLDSHFSALTFRASFHAPTRQALGCVMDAVATADEAAQEVEKALGMWTHVCRVADSGGEHKAPNTSLYQQERLQF